MIHPSKLQEGEAILDEGLAQHLTWLSLAEELNAQGFNDEEVATLFRLRDTWLVEAREMKSEGYPYDEILYHLILMRASWADVGRALMDVGLTPADMLRTVFPFTSDEDQWSVVQSALLDGPEDADYGEVQGVLTYFFIDGEEAMRVMDLEGAERLLAAKRIGL